MKKNVLITILALFIQTVASSQSCLPEGISFVIQQDIDEFTTYYPNCTEIEGDVTISGGWDLDSLYKITRIGGFLRILDNDEIDDFVGLDSLTTIGGYFEIFSCEDLDDLSGLESLTSIGGDLEIVQNYNLGNLTGLSSLTSIGGHLHIRYNYLLEDITGLLGLTSLGNNDLRIHNNHDLTSLHGLDNIDYNTISDLQIITNSSLSECAVKSICEFLSNTTGFLLIFSNDPGCNSQNEIEEECQNLAVNEDYSNNILISPNPADDLIKISINSNDEIVELFIYNSIGQKKLHKINHTNNIDISMLKNGIYIIDLRTVNMKYRQKLIIKR